MDRLRGLFFPQSRRGPSQSGQGDDWEEGEFVERPSAHPLASFPYEAVKDYFDQVLKDLQQKPHFDHNRPSVRLTQQALVDSLDDHPLILHQLPIPTSRQLRINSKYPFLADLFRAFDYWVSDESRVKHLVWREYWDWATAQGDRPLPRTDSGLGPYQPATWGDAVNLVEDYRTTKLQTLLEPLLQLLLDPPFSRQRLSRIFLDRNLDKANSKEFRSSDTVRPFSFPLLVGTFTSLHDSLPPHLEQPHGLNQSQRKDLGRRLLKALAERLGSERDDHPSPSYLCPFILPYTPHLVHAFLLFNGADSRDLTPEEWGDLAPAEWQDHWISLFEVPEDGVNESLEDCLKRAGMDKLSWGAFVRRLAQEKARRDREDADSQHWRRGW